MPIPNAITNDENNQVVTKLEPLYRQYCVLVNSVSIITIPDHKPTGLLNKKSQDKVLRSREEGDVDTTNKQIDFKELARERKEEKEKAKKQQEDTENSHMRHVYAQKLNNRNKKIFQMMKQKKRKKKNKKDKNYLKNTQMKLKSYQVYCNQ